ncbi:MAG: hypothetical protein NTW40_03475 [Acidobacteria bacterium]|nr:hypothetical protein [Acidobacteriota bacterium]
MIGLSDEFEALVAMLTLESVVKNIWPTFPADSNIESFSAVRLNFLESSVGQIAFNDSNDLPQIRRPSDVELGA